MSDAVSSVDETHDPFFSTLDRKAFEREAHTGHRDDGVEDGESRFQTLVAHVLDDLQEVLDDGAVGAW